MEVELFDSSSSGHVTETELMRTELRAFRVSKSCFMSSSSTDDALNWWRIHETAYRHVFAVFREVGFISANRVKCERISPTLEF